MDTRIRELRTSCGMTRQEPADAIAVSSRTVISLEKGRYTPPVLPAHKIARAFDLRIGEVFLFGPEGGL